MHLAYCTFIAKILKYEKYKYNIELQIYYSYKIEVSSQHMSLTVLDVFLSYCFSVYNLILVVKNIQRYTACINL